MFKKNSDGNFISEHKAGTQFQQGTKFVMGGNVFTILEAFESDNTPMRRLRSATGDADEIIMLSSLQRDADLSGDFKIMQD